MNKREKLSAIRETLGTEQAVKGDEVIFFCPKHGKKAGRTSGQLSVNLFKDEFHCWTCQWGGFRVRPDGTRGSGLLPLFKDGDPRKRDYLRFLEEFTVRVDKPKVYDRPILPTNFKSLSKPTRSPFYTRAIAYLNQRGVTLEDILLYKLGYCEDGEYKNRIIIPSFDSQGELNFFVGRTYYNDPRKFKHGEFDKDVIFNEYMIDWTKSVIITEGPFDAIKAGTNAIPLQGNSMQTDSTMFRRVLFEGKPVYFALDSDVPRQQLRVVNKFLRHGAECMMVNLAGKKDPGEMSKEEFRSQFEKATRVSSTDLLKVAVHAGVKIGSLN